ncbi:MAG: nucleoside-diphosphate kinase [Candidatus Thorarchaeota archaeon]|jgi:nucleoside-diphosphate kinase
MERSLVIIKPDGTVRRNVGARVLEALMDRGYRVKAFKEMRVSESLARLHYEVHKEKPFFPWLVQFISSAPVLAMILEADGVIQGVRDALGATFVQKAAPESLRGKYGIWAGVNIAHASDAPETAATEIALWTQEGGLTESENADKIARAYVDKYAKTDVDYTAEIRNQVRVSIEKGDVSDQVLKSLETLFGKDSEGVPESGVKALAMAVFDFVKEEVEKQ